jgi:hypothetical protein
MYAGNQRWLRRMWEILSDKVLTDKIASLLFLMIGVLSCKVSSVSGGLITDNVECSAHEITTT